MELKELTAIRGVSGDEGRVRAYILERARALADDVRVDRMGNVFAHKAGIAPGARRVAFCAHMDEVGLIVAGIQDNGLLHYQTVGGIDARVMVSKRVLIGEKLVPGVIGAKAIHLQTRSEMETPLKHDEMYIDIGAKDKAAAEALVSLGDYVSFDGDYVPFGDSLVKSKALDDRVGCYTMLRLLGGRYPCDLTCVFSVQEETGLRGAQVAAHQLEADCAIVLEGTTANDLGDVPEHLRVCRLGGGVAISFMDRASISHPALNRALCETAKREGIAWQHKTFVSGGNDAGALQTGKGALNTCVLSVPCRYIHSPASVASLKDIEAQYELAAAFLQTGAAY